MATSTTTANASHDKVDAVASKAHDVIDAAEQKAQAGIEAGRARADEVVQTAQQYEAQAREAITDGSEQLTRYIQEKPLQAAGIAFAAGVLATMLLRRS